ncbi:MAG: YXWGXW repeat-containing protein [Caldimonas sp.]
MKIGQLTAVALLAAASAGFSAPAVSAPYGVDIRVAPPAPRVEAVPEPRRGYVWAPGYWDWTGHRHHWVAGHWVRERRGYVYTPPEWVNEGDHWRLRRGAWGRRDRDHDGVPNRFDRDRDGDGVPNSRDRGPDNPNRQ